MLAGWGQRIGGYRFDTITTGYRVGCNWGSLDDTGHKQDKAHDEKLPDWKIQTQVFLICSLTLSMPKHATECCALSWGERRTRGHGKPRWL